MRKIITGILIVMLSAATSQAVYAKAVGKFVKVEGRVDITRPGNTAEPVNVGTEIFEKDIIRSKSDSKAEILFVDGNVLRLAQKTRVEVSEYISDSNSRSTILNLFRGKIQNKVKKLFGSVFGDEKNRYEVHTPTSVCGVRGTDFFMSYQRGVSQATFKEGFGYGYNRNQPDSMVEVRAGQSMVIAGVNTPPTVRAVPQGEINQLEGETTPVEEEDSEQLDDSVGEENSVTGEDSSEKEGTLNEPESADGTYQEPSGADDAAPADDSSIALAEALPSETLSYDDSGYLMPDESIMDPMPESDQPENTVQQIIGTNNPTDPVSSGPTGSPEITIPEVLCPDQDNCDNTDLGGFYVSAVTDPTLTDPVPTDPIPADPTPTDPVPTDPTPKMVLSGKLMGLAAGTHYEGEYIMPRSTDPFRSGDMGPMEGGRYEYDYFLASDGTYLRGFSEEKNAETGTWTMYDYLPDGTLFIETGTEGGSNPQITESTWTQTSIASISTPPAGYYERYTLVPFAASMITGIGNFTGEIQVPSGLWLSTQSVPLDISLSGQFISSGDPLYLIKSPLSGSFTAGGAYSGLISGTADNTTGFINALYINPEGTELGILKGDFSGTFSTGGDWSASGTMYPMVFSIDPGAVTNDNFLTSIDDSGYLEIERLTGNFSGGSGAGIKAYGFGNTSYVSGQDWGIFDLVFGYGDYVETDVSSTWSGSVSGFGMFGENGDGMWIADITGGSWLADGISGDINGRYLTMTTAGTIDGSLIGPAGATGDWTGVSQGSWQKTDDLQFSSSLNGGLYTIRQEEGGNYWMAGDASWYSYRYDLESDQGGYQFYDSVNDTDTYMQVNKWDYDGTVTDFQLEEWVYDRTSSAFVSYSASTATTFALTNLSDATANTGLTWDYSDTWTNYNMYHTGWFEGILGGLASPWTATSGSPAGITLLGFYEVPFYIAPGDSIIFANDIESFNPDNGSFTTFDGGAFTGFISGQLSSSVYGNLYAIYIDPASNAGILIGEMQGSADSIYGTWDADGEVYPVRLFSSIGVPPGNLTSSLQFKDYYIWNDSSYGGEGGYFFDGSGAVIGDLDVGGGDFFSKNIGGEPWGVWQNVVGGSYTGTTGSDWEYGIHQEMRDEFDNVSGMTAKYGVPAGNWSGNQIDGEVLGAWVDLEDVVVGVSSGQIKGTYDPTEMTWQTYGSGVWIKAGQFIDMAATATGRANLTELNIPAFEIGRTALSGTGSTISVTMNDVTFFAPSTGEAPQVWATNNISGTYSVTPYIGDYVYMSNSDSSVTADFTLSKWDNSNWAADISNGNGTLNRTDVAGTVGVEFGGVAGGTYTGTASGSFSGEGAGVVR